MAKVNAMLTSRKSRLYQYILTDDSGVISARFPENKCLKVGETVMIFNAKAIDIKQRTELKLMKEG